MLPLTMEYISYSITAVLVVGVLLGIVKYKGLPASLRFLHLYLFFGLATDLAFRGLGELGYNLFFIPIYALLELYILALFFYRHIFNQSRPILYIAMFTALLIAADVLLLSNLFAAKTFTTYSRFLQDLVIVLYCLWWYYAWLKGRLKTPRWQLFINVTLVYFTVNLLLFTSVSFLINEARQFISWFWLLNNILTVVFYACITYYLWQHGKTQPTLQRG